MTSAYSQRPPLCSAAQAAVQGRIKPEVSIVGANDFPPRQRTSSGGMPTFVGRGRGSFGIYIYKRCGLRFVLPHTSARPRLHRPRVYVRKDFGHPVHIAARSRLVP